MIRLTNEYDANVTVLSVPSLNCVESSNENAGSRTGFPRQAETGRLLALAALKIHKMQQRR